MSPQVPIGKLKELDLTDPKVFEAFEKKVQDQIMFDRSLDAFWFGQIIDSLLLQPAYLSVELSFIEKYKRLVIKTRWVALNLLPEKEIVEMFEKYFAEMIDVPDYSAWLKLKQRLVSMLIFEERDVLKKNIIDALMRNQQKITDKNIIIEEKEFSPIIANWLKDYIRAMGIGPLDKLKQAEYFSKSKNMAAMDISTREKIISLFNFYERARLSSLTAEGLEETIPVPAGELADVEGVIRNGRFEPMDMKIVKEMEETLNKVFPNGRVELENLTKQEEITKSYLGTGEEQKILEEEKEEIKKNTREDPDKLRDELHEAIALQPGKAPKKEKVLATLKILAETDNLDNLLSENKKFSEVLVSCLKEKGRTAEIEGFKVNPGAPQYLSVFLQHILKDILEMSENDSARFGMQLMNLFKEKGKDSKYFGLTYFDSSTGEFRWS